MISTELLPLFLATALVLLLTPGPAVLFIIARSLEGGSRAGVASALGVFVGGFAHVAAAALGLSALLISSPTAFAAIKYLGAAYLIYIGIRTLLKRDQEEATIDTPTSAAATSAASDTTSPRPQVPMSLFLQGIVVQLLNVKTAIFFFSFLPQFVDPTIGSVSTQLGLLGLLFQGIALCTDSMFALLAGSLGRWIARRRDVRRAQTIIAGVTYIALGLVAALAASPS